MRRFVLLAAVGAMLLAVVPARAATARYAGNSADAAVLDCAAGIGGACFSVPNNKAKVAVSIDDDVFDYVGGVLEVWGSATQGGVTKPSVKLLSTTFCNSIANVNVAPASRWDYSSNATIFEDPNDLKVFVGGAAAGAQQCTARGQVGGPGTAGLVTATFS